MKGLSYNSSCAIVREALRKLNNSNGPRLPWDATRNARKSCKFFLSGEWFQKIHRIVITGFVFTDIQGNRFHHGRTLGHLEASFGIHFLLVRNQRQIIAAGCVRSACSLEGS